MIARNKRSKSSFRGRWFRLLSLLLGVQLLAGAGFAAELQSFTSDGCSRFPDGLYGQADLWHSCCVEHDLAYWRGGSWDERLAADRALQACVAATGQDEIANLMLVGVRLGGSPWWPTSYRWGYGWPWLRGYQPLSGDELLQVEQRLAEYRSGVTNPVDKALPIESTEVGNWHQVSAQLYRSAQPSPAGFAEIKQRGIRSVLNLRALHDDDDEADGLGLELYRVPMYAFSLNEDKVVEALRIIHRAPKPILVHCLHGADRTGTIVALYRILFQHWSRDAAIREMTSDQYGFHALFGNLVDFIRGSDLNKLREKVFAETVPAY